MSPTRPITPITNIADALTLHSDATDVSAEYGGRDAGMPTFWPPSLSSEVTDLTAQYMPPQPSGSVRTRRRLPRLPVAAASDLGYLRHESDTLSRRPDHTFSRSASAVTSRLPHQLANAPTRPPPVDEVMTSMVPRPLAVPVDEVMTSMVPRPLAVPVDEVMISALPRPPAVPMHDAPTSALPRPLIAPGDLPFGDYTMQRPAAPVDSRNLYTHSIDRLLADLTPPMHVPTQPIVPLSSEHIQTTASEYVNTNFLPSLSAHAYANTPFHGSVPSLPAMQLRCRIIKIFLLVCPCLLCRHLRTCRLTLVRCRRTLMTVSACPLLLNKLIFLLFHV